ncbi:hypothetical protein HOLleu_14234 [Holothuria leucospilota]|uniref:Uncharacterized protein n=1 Tax=Holothuria leucospilota TaxID=206669 RepID=A0A9Q1H8T3_HOLLE|nr:hypothetical protein HOLleu_14234 [Holothuria leucospilota]
MGGIVKSSEKSSRPFKSGHGSVVKSTEKVIIEAKIGKTKCNILTEVVPINLPLLLRKESLKRAETHLNIHQHKATMFGEKIQLEMTSTGHYCVDIIGQRENEEVMYSKSSFKGSDSDNKNRMLFESAKPV